MPKFEQRSQAQACLWYFLANVLPQSLHPLHFDVVDPPAQICVLQFEDSYRPGNFLGELCEVRSGSLLSLERRRAHFRFSTAEDEGIYLGITCDR